MKKKKLITMIGCIIAGILTILLLVASFQLISKMIRDKEEENKVTTFLWSSGKIEHNGQFYRYNDETKTYLIMGIDSMDPVVEQENHLYGGQSDALFLLVINEREKAWNIVAINRNTMTTVETCMEDGMPLGHITAQICLQHGYGDGKEESCERTVRTVSKTLFNLPIDGYASINMGAIPTVNDAIGGVTVHTMDGVSIHDEYMDIEIPADQDVELHGWDAWGYLIWRDTTAVDGASRRLERQKQYIMSAYEKVLSSDVNKIQLFTDMLSVVKDYTVMDIPAVELGYQVISYEKNLSQIYAIPGEDRAGEKYIEFYMDENATLDMLYELYYEPVDEK